MALVAWVKVAALVASDRERALKAFVCLSVEDWIGAAERRFYARHGRLPAAAFEPLPRRSAPGS